MRQMLYVLFDWIAHGYRSLAYIYARLKPNKSVALQWKWCRGVVVKRANSQHRGYQFESCTSRNKTLLVTMTPGNHLIKSTSLKKLRALSLVYATLKIDNATHFFI